MTYQYRKATSYLLALATIIAAATGCADTKLRRSKAADFIKNSESFEMHNLGVWICIDPCPDHPFSSTPASEKLLSLGYLRGSAAGGTFTEKGKALSEVGAGAMMIGKTRLKLVPLADAQFIEVTGIVQEQNKATADFAWRWVPRTIVKDALGNDLEDVVPKEPIIGVATFTLYDDGWRLVKILFERP
jgi:hypothetical protein